MAPTFFRIFFGVIFCLEMWQAGCDIGTSFSSSPCIVSRDSIYNGTFLNCQHKNLTNLSTLPNRIPTETTTLSLAFNSLRELSRASFHDLSQITRLRVLDLRFNKISSIGREAFSGFCLLHKLFLGNNQINLGQEASNQSTFHGLPHLQDLDIGHNGNGDRKVRYSNLLFKDLSHLKTLILDILDEEYLQFGSLFRKTPRLTSLTLTGSRGTLANNSFESSDLIKLERLIINFDRFQITQLESGAFKPLKSLNWLEITSSQELESILRSLAPFAHKKFKQLRLIRAHPFMSSLSGKIYSRNAVLTRDMARYLSTMCVENFVLQRYLISVIELSVLTNPTWRRCLKTLDVTGNPFLGEKVEALRLLSMPRLEKVRAVGYKYEQRSGSDLKIWTLPTCPSTNFKRKLDSKMETLKTVKSVYHDSSDVSDIMVSYADISTMKNASNIRRKNNNEAMNHHRSSRQTHQQILTLYISNSLELINLDFWDNSMFRWDKGMYFRGAKRLRELHLSGNDIFYFTGLLQGLNDLQIVDLSHNDGSIMSPSFFDPLYSLVHLNLANIKLDSAFMAGHSDRLLRNLSRLVTLDLSSNNLRFLAKGTFDVHPELSVLNLARNRLQSIPLNLKNHGKLCLLDMRENLLSKFSDKEIVSLEDHFIKMNRSFSLVLNGNVFFCGCMNIRFLAWLRRTRINIDKKGNYTCILDSGVRTHILNINDLEAMWRMCNGQKAFWISTVSMCILILGFMGHILTSKFKTQISACLLKAFSSGFIVKGPMSYQVGVYIGYADPDTHLACHCLRPFIEDELHLSTYIRHRDLLPASDMAQSIMEAVHSSWRVLLVISDHFLSDPWSYYLLKVSTYAVQLENPRRLVVIITDGGDRKSLLTKLPGCVLQAVREESIITMTTRGNISYEDKQALKSALRYQKYRL